MDTIYLVAAVAFFVTACIYGLMARSVWQKDGKSEGDWVFLFTMVALAYWCFSNAVASSFGTILEKPRGTLGWILLQTSYPVLYAVPPAIRHCMVLSQLPATGWRKWAGVALNYLVMVPVVVHLHTSPRPLPEHYGPAFSGPLFFYIPLTLIEIWKRKALRARYAQKPGLQQVIWAGMGGALLLAEGPSLLCLLYPDKTDFIALISKFAALPPALAIAYGVLRYRFMDMVLKRSLLYSALSCLLLGLYLLVVRYGAEWLALAGGQPSVLSELIVILILLFAFQPLKEGIQKEIDRLFFCSCRRLRSAEVQHSLSHALTTWSDLAGVCRNFVEKIGENLGVEHGAVMFADGTVYGAGEGVEAVRALPLPVFLHVGPPPLVVEELAEGPLKSACAKAGIGLVVALPCRERRAWLLLGEKRSGGPFFSEELGQLEALCGQLATAVDNCSLFQANIALEREVRHREKLAAIGQLAATVAHEIRNPIAGAKCLLQQVEEEMGDVPRGKEYVRLALEDLGRVEQSVSQLLTFARKEEYRYSEQDVTEVVRAAVARFAAQVQEKGVTVRFVGDAPVWAAIDEEKIRRVLLNLLANAADAVDGDGEITVRVGVADAGVAICVSDSGRGLAPEDREKIFEPFFTRKEKGTGLGLAIAQKIVEGHGGQLAVASTPGHGTTLTLTIPRRRPEARVAA